MTPPLPPEQAIRRAVGPAAFERGRPYAATGRVSELRIADDQIFGRVRGTGAAPYQVVVSYGDDPAQLHGTCSCPMAANCKHVAAVALTALAERSRQTAVATLRRGDRSPDWQQRLQGLLATAESTLPGIDQRPIGLQVEAVVPQRHTRLYSNVPDEPTRLRLRPVTIGKRGDWVRQGVSWPDLEYGGYGSWSRHRAREPLLALYRWLRNQSSGYYGYGQDPLYLDGGGLGVWPLLDDVLDAGVPLIFGRSGSGSVIRTPVGVSLDITHAAGMPARLSASLDAGPDPSALPIGDPPVGLWAVNGSGKEQQLVLWRFDRRLDPLTTGLLQGRPLEIPDADLPTFRAQFLPRLRRVTDIVSSDDSVQLPEITRPRVLVQACYADDHQVLLEWFFRYRIGDNTYRVAVHGNNYDDFADDQRAEVGRRTIAVREAADKIMRQIAELHLAAAGRNGDDVRSELPGPMGTPFAGQTFADDSYYDDSADGSAEFGGHEFGGDELGADEFGGDEFGREPGPAGPARDPGAEQVALDALELSRPELAMLVEQIGGRVRPRRLQRFSGMATVAFTQQTLPLLRSMDLDVEVIGTALEYRSPDSDPVVEIGVADSTDRDWFNLAISVTVDGVDVPFALLFTALATGRPLLLDNGIYFDVDRPEFHQLRHLIEQARELADPETGELRINPLHAGLWEELVALGVVNEQSEAWRSSVDGLLDLTELPAPPPPASFRAELRAYQLTGYHWLMFLWQQRLGGILADDMGLGKTVQALAAVQQMVDGGERRPVLVVAPTSVVGNWATEAAKFAPELGVAVVSETLRRRGKPLTEVADGAAIVVTSYALLRLEYDSYAGIDWAAAFLDEAQAVKNHRAKTYQCARRLPADFKLAITGTPLENNLMELWALLSIVAPGLFPDPEKFTEHYRHPIERGTDPQALEVLRRRIRPLMLRRTKELVATELPPKQEQVLSVELYPKHRKIYQTQLARERQKVLGLLDDVQRNRFEILQALTKLRQLALSAWLVDEEHAGVPSAKIDTLVEQLTELASEGHRALVFSQFTRFLGQVRDRLTAEGIEHVYLDGRTKNRQAKVAEFTTGTAPVFLISLKAGGFGLNLTEADYCFVLDPWWNPAAEAQAIDRTHRIGQTRPVMVYRLISADTIEEKVLALQQSKRDLFARVIEDGGQLGSALTVDDLRGLLS
ncbi:DEAD/DEAH box helicase [Nakamurella lactea]|uniref:DEAD/DEAH box helicase n=1 Tax=Nakamurella lactea TaxID=459515 RepID=UPI0004241BEA|nr:DEAD/DEAH box helicase [Nakamurella lactea]